MPKQDDILERVMSRVEKTASCWIWTGPVDKDGYGRIRVGGRKIKGVHRISWEAHSGASADGLLVCHHCDTPSCVNPSHLFLGTVLENNRDKMAKGRGVFHRGQAAGMAKLTDACVQEMFGLYGSGKWRQADLAAKFGVSQSAVHLILAGKTWVHIGQPPVMGMRHAPKRGLRKLSDESAAALVAEYRCGGISQNSLAKKYGVSQQYVSVAVKTG